MVKLLAFTDTHASDAHLARIMDIAQRERPQVIACVGDFTVFGRNMARLLAKINALPAPIVLIHGNHEDEESLIDLLPRFPNVHFAHGRVVSVAGLSFFGWGGGGFRSREPELEAAEREQASHFSPAMIVLCHQPPLKTALDAVEDDWHVGSQSLRELIVRRRPMLALSGHIHECFHARDTLAGCTLINPGPDGELIEIALGEDA
jgi:Icc-related predicted phosphoesterase